MAQHETKDIGTSGNNSATCKNCLLFFFRLRKMGKVDSAKARHHKRKTEDNNLENKNLSYSAKSNRAKI